MLALLDSSAVILAIVVGVPLALVIALLASSLSRVPRLVSAVAALVAVGVIGVSAWALYRAPPPAPILIRRGLTRPLPTIAPTGAPGPSPQATCSPSGTQLTETAHDITFQATCLAAPANQAFTIAFTNSDPGTMHDMHIYTADPLSDPSAGSLFMGQLVTGPATVTYQVNALPPGTYFFHCDVHPTRMFGAFVVR